MRSISDLNQEEMENLIKDYKSPASIITVSQIIEKYDLDVSVAKLVSSLPEQMVEDICPYCQVPMYAHIKNRTEMKEAHCRKCGHAEYKEQRWSWRKMTCECENCQKAIEEKKKIRRNLIKINYGWKYKQFRFDELSLSEKINLCKIIKESEKHDHCICLNHRYKKYRREVIELYKKHIISVSPLSPLEAFVEKDFPTSFYLEKVFFNVNVNLLNGTNLENIEDIFDYFEVEYKKTPAKEKYDLFMEIMHRDILKRFESKMNERKLGFEVLSEAEDALKALYNKLSYSKIMKLCERVAVHYLDLTTTKGVYKSVAAKGAVKCVVTFYENAIKNKWNLIDDEVSEAGDELKYYVTEVMKMDIRILREVITIEDFE